MGQTNNTLNNFDNININKNNKINNINNIKNFTTIKSINNYKNKKYNEAYEIMGNKLYTIPIKYIIDYLQKNNWNIYDIIFVLYYIKQYTIIIYNDIPRINEIDTWIDYLFEKYS